MVALVEAVDGAEGKAAKRGPYKKPVAA
jgi:hypothetical protein